MYYQVEVLGVWIPISRDSLELILANMPVPAGFTPEEWGDGSGVLADIEPGGPLLSIETDRVSFRAIKHRLHTME